MPESSVSNCFSSKFVARGEVSGCRFNVDYPEDSDNSKLEKSSEEVVNSKVHKKKRVTIKREKVATEASEKTNAAILNLATSTGAIDISTNTNNYSTTEEIATERDRTDIHQVTTETSEACSDGYTFTDKEVARATTELHTDLLNQTVINTTVGSTETYTVELAKNTEITTEIISHGVTENTVTGTFVKDADKEKDGTDSPPALVQTSGREIYRFTMVAPHIVVVLEIKKTDFEE